MTLRYRVSFVLIALTAALFTLWPAHAANHLNLINIDTSFGRNGISLLNIGGPGGANGRQEDEPFWMLTQPDGKYVVAGKALNLATGNKDFTILRYKANGQLDSSFGWNGIVLVDFLGADDEALSVALQPDGKIIAGGLAGRPDGSTDFGLVRLNPNGSRDTSFGWNGIVMTDFYGQRDQVLTVIVLNDGKILAGGYAYRPNNTDSEFALARYNPDGSRDNSFGITGISTANFWDKTDAIFKMTLQPDGKILGVGVATRPDGTSDFAVGRFNANGVRDNSFGLGGLVATDILGDSDVAYSLVLQPDGKLVVGGLAFSKADNSDDMALVRYNTNGSLDTSFATYGAPGKLALDFDHGYDQALWLVLQPDDKILAIGHAVGQTDSFNFALARFTPAGDPDPSFGDNGRFMQDFFDGPDGAHTAQLAADGSLVVAGDAFNPASDSDDFMLIKYYVSDPSWIGGVVSKLSGSAFASPADKASALDLLDDAQTAVDSGDETAATTALQQLDTHLQGCPSQPDTNAWIVDCQSQVKVRNLTENVLSRLSN